MNSIIINKKNITQPHIKKELPVWRIYGHKTHHLKMLFTLV